MWRVALFVLVCLVISAAVGCGPSYTDADAARDQVQEADALEAEIHSGEEMDPDEEE